MAELTNRVSKIDQIKDGKEFKDIVRIEMPTGFPIGPMNSYLVLGRVPTLIDIGTVVPGNYELLIQGLAEQGLTPNDVRQLVITHNHPDHIGLANRFRKASGAKVISHEMNAIMSEPQDRLLDRWQESLTDLSIYCGVPEDFLEQYRESVTAIMDNMIEPVQLDITIKHGDTLTMGDMSWEVMYTPGHTSGSICLYQRETKRMIAGDTLLGKKRAIPMAELSVNGVSERLRPLVTYMETLAVLEPMDIDIIYAGHDAPFSDHRSRIHDVRGFHAYRKETIFESIQSGCNTVYAIARRLFPKMTVFEFTFILSEILAHLDLLEQESRIAYDIDSQGLAHVRLL